MPVKKFWESVNISQRYGQNFVAYFFGPPCISLETYALNLKFVALTFLELLTWRCFIIQSWFRQFMSHCYLSHCYAIAMGQIIRSPASVCLSVCVCVSFIAPTVAILNRIWWNFAHLFGVGKLRSSSRGQNPIMSYPIITPIFPKFH